MARHRRTWIDGSPSARGRASTVPERHGRLPRAAALLCALASGGTGATPTLAADPAPAVGPAVLPPPDWGFDLAIYGWATGFKGRVGTLPPLPPVSVDLGFADVVSNLDGALMGAFAARYGRFVFLGDVLYAKLSGSARTPGPFFSSATIDTSSLIGTAAAGYRVVDDPRFWLDVVGGLRGYSVFTELALGAGLLPARTIGESEAWVDPIVGARARVVLTDSLFLTAWGFVGGFGIASDQAWDVFGGLGYSFSPATSAIVGYRALGVDYRSGRFLYDVVQQGPIMSLVLRF